MLDLGCGPDSPIQYCHSVRYSVGVEPFSPYLKRSKLKGIHSKYLNAKIEDIKLPSKSFDAVVMVEVLEHLTKDDGLKALKKAERIARKKVLITTPNGFVSQGRLDKNILQRHRSGWSVSELEALGFKVYGLSGLKHLRSDAEKNSMGQDITVSIRFRPRLFWFGMATLSQSLTFYFPELAFELFAVKRVVPQ